MAALVADGHVILQTLNTAAQHTGDRYFLQFYPGPKVSTTAYIKKLYLLPLADVQLVPFGDAVKAVSNG